MRLLISALSMLYAASECIPITFLISECHNWFSNSSSRQHIYCKLYETINLNSTPFKISAQSQTRWLSIQIAVERIVNQ